MGRGFPPLDEELQLLPGSLTPTLVESMVRLGAWMTFEPASKMLSHFTRATASEPTVRRATLRAGRAHVQIQEAEAERLEREAPESPEGPELQLLSVDGAMVPLVGGRWAEVKTLALGTVRQVVVKGESQAVAEELSYFSRMTDHETFGHLATVETHRRGTERARRVCAVNDGADWEQGFVDYHRPDAERILDWGHASEHLAEAARAVYGDGKAETGEWLGGQLRELKGGDPRSVLSALRGLAGEVEVRVGAGRRGEALKEVADTLAYLEKRREQIRYAEFLSQGYPIGSGAVESANKLVVEARLKGSGKHWADRSVDPMLALRNVVCSDRWEEAWSQIAGRLRREPRRRAPARNGEAQADLAVAAITQPVPTTEPAGNSQAAKRHQSQSPAAARSPSGSRPRRPPSNHPWRRMIVGRAHLSPPLPNPTYPES